ncbi:MAG: hypothetical protein H0V81_14325, partial [Solirubrobacterales bacterium]|nr:hypothetical protein [Solirubrobacterales bacterium]
MRTAIAMAAPEESEGPDRPELSMTGLPGPGLSDASGVAVEFEVDATGEERWVDPRLRSRRHTDPVVLALFHRIVQMSLADQEHCLRCAITSLTGLSPGAQQRAFGALSRCIEETKLGQGFPAAGAYDMWRRGRLNAGERALDVPSNKAIRNAFGGTWQAAKAA